MFTGTVGILGLSVFLQIFKKKSMFSIFVLVLLVCGCVFVFLIRLTGFGCLLPHLLLPAKNLLWLACTVVFPSAVCAFAAFAIAVAAFVTSAAEIASTIPWL